MSDERAVQEVLARYVRAVDARNADNVAALYVERGVEKFSYNRAGVHEQFAVLDPQHWLDAACLLAGRNLSQQEWDHYLGSFGEYHQSCNGDLFNP